MLRYLLAALPTLLAWAVLYLTRPRKAAAMPIDLDAARAERHAHGEPATQQFTLGQETFTIPHLSTWRVQAVELLRQGNLVGVLRKVMGDDQYEVFLDKDPDMDDVRALFDALAEEAGLGSTGNSSPSTASPETTGEL